MKRKKKGTRLMSGGLLLIAAALLLTCFNLWDEQRAANSAGEALQELEVVCSEQAETTEPGELPDYLLAPDLEMPAVEEDGGDYIGVLELPLLGLELPVMESWSYPDLRVAPCRYSGSAYQDDMVVAAHNYKSHFGRLKELRPGDEVRFTALEGTVFRSAVAELEALGKLAVETVTPGDWDLTLFTCTYGGKSRVTVRCQRMV